jgi:hypothetical protein
MATCNPVVQPWGLKSMVNYVAKLTASSTPEGGYEMTGRVSHFWMILPNESSAHSRFQADNLHVGFTNHSLLLFVTLQSYSMQDKAVSAGPQ